MAADTVERLAADFIEKYAKRRTRPNTQRQTEHVLRDIVLPAWRGRTVHDIRRRDVIALIDHVAEGRPVQANRTLAILSKFYKWMMARDVIVASPVVGVARPAKETARDRSLSDAEIKALWLACDAVGGPMAPCIKVLLLTGQRRSEVAGMRWDEVAGELWSLPPSRVKNNRPHSVPLSRQVLAIIEAVPRIGDHVFTINGATPLTGFSGFKREIDAVLALSQPFVWHDMRRTLPPACSGSASGPRRLSRCSTIEAALIAASSASIRPTRCTRLVATLCSAGPTTSTPSCAANRPARSSSCEGDLWQTNRKRKRQNYGRGWHSPMTSGAARKTIKRVRTGAATPIKWLLGPCGNMLKTTLPIRALVLARAPSRAPGQLRPRKTAEGAEGSSTTTAEAWEPGFGDAPCDDARGGLCDGRRLIHGPAPKHERKDRGRSSGSNRGTAGRVSILA